MFCSYKFCIYEERRPCTALSYKRSLCRARGRVVSILRESEKEGLLGFSEGLKGIKESLGLPRSFGFLGGQPDLHHLLAVFHSLLFGKIEVPENVQHALVRAFYERVKGPNLVTSRFFD
jgi:hypothetical protein